MAFLDEHCSFCNHTRFGHDVDTQECKICDCKHFKESQYDIDQYEDDPYENDSADD